MNRCAILITTGFPFAGGEPYLEAEIPVLSRAFSRVLIFAIGLPPDTAAALPLPENVTAFNCARGSRRRNRLRDLLHGLPAVFRLPALPPEDRREAGASPARRLFLGYFLSRVRRHTAEIADALADTDFSQYDDVVVYGYWLFAAAACAARLRPVLEERGAKRVRVISRAHGYDLYAYANRLGYLPCRTALLRSLDAVFPCSDDGAAYLKKRYPAFADKIEPAFLGTDGGVCTDGSADGVFRILTCARTVPLKRLDLLARALQTLGTDRPVEWTHVGDGPSLPGLRKIAQTFPAGVTARFTGALAHEDVLRFYREHPVDLFVLVSSREGLPVSVMEALSFGVPAVVTDVGGCTELVRDGENGYVLPRETSPAQIAQTICRAMADGQRLRCAAFDTWRSRFVARENYLRFVQRISIL